MCLSRSARRRAYSIVRIPPLPLLGKSTIVAMIERFYDPEEGTLRVGGVDVREIDVHWLHRHVALVGQEPVLFALSIADNIRFGKVRFSISCTLQILRCCGL